MKSTLGVIWSCISFVLILICIGGIAIRTFSPDGWAEQLIGIIWEAEVRSPLIMTPVIGGTLFMASVFLRGGLQPSTTGLASNILVLLMSLGGAYFAVAWVRAML